MDISFLDSGTSPASLRGYATLGMRRYATMLIRTLPVIDPSIELYLFCSPTMFRALQADVPGVQLRWLWPPSLPHGPFVRAVAQQSVLPVVAARNRVDVIHGTAHVLPLASALQNVRTVLTIGDFRYVEHPEAFSLAQRSFRALVYGRSIALADRILAISGFTRDQCERLFPGSKTRTTLSPLGVEDRYAPQEPTTLIARLKLMGLTPGYLLASGSQPHKRAPMVLEAMAVLARQFGLAPEFVIFGAPQSVRGRLQAAASSLGVGGRAHILGHVPDEALPALYAGAEVFLFPSNFEGFGLPVLEAMASGVSVIAANNTAIRETAGDAALLLESPSPAALADSVARLITSPALREKLRAVGLARAAKYSWRNTAAITLDAYTGAKSG